MVNVIPLGLGRSRSRKQKQQEAAANVGVATAAAAAASTGGSSNSNRNSTIMDSVARRRNSSSKHTNNASSSTSGGLSSILKFRRNRSTPARGKRDGGGGGGGEDSSSTASSVALPASVQSDPQIVLVRHQRRQAEEEEEEEEVVVDAHDGGEEEEGEEYNDDDEEQQDGRFGNRSSYRRKNSGVQRDGGHHSSSSGTRGRPSSIRQVLDTKALKEENDELAASTPRTIQEEEEDDEEDEQRDDVGELKKRREQDHKQAPATEEEDDNNNKTTTPADDDTLAGSTVEEADTRGSEAPRDSKKVVATLGSNAPTIASSAAKDVHVLSTMEGEEVVLADSTTATTLSRSAALAATGAARIQRKMARRRQERQRNDDDDDDDDYSTILVRVRSMDSPRGRRYGSSSLPYSPTRMAAAARTNRISVIRTRSADRRARSATPGRGPTPDTVSTGDETIASVIVSSAASSSSSVNTPQRIAEEPPETTADPRAATPQPQEEAAAAAPGAPAPVQDDGNSVPATTASTVPKSHSEPVSAPAPPIPPQDNGDHHHNHQVEEEEEEEEEAVSLKDDEPFDEETINLDPLVAAAGQREGTEVPFDENPYEDPTILEHESQERLRFKIHFERHPYVPPPAIGQSTRELDKATAAAAAAAGGNNSSKTRPSSSDKNNQSAGQPSGVLLPKQYASVGLMLDDMASADHLKEEGGGKTAAPSQPPTILSATPKAFMDAICAPCGFDDDVNASSGVESNETNRKTTMMSNQFIQQFLMTAIQDGLALILHEPPSDRDAFDGELDWKQTPVKMFVKGNSRVGSPAMVEHPRLLWGASSTWAGMEDDDDDDDGHHDAAAATTTTSHNWKSLDLLDIDDVQGSPNITMTEVRPNPDHLAVEAQDTDADDACFFTVTSGNGDVFVFEALSLKDRDAIVAGLRGVVAGLAHGLVSGNAVVAANAETTSVVSQLIKDDDDASASLEDYSTAAGDLPSLKTQRQTINEVTHSFLQ